jgi:hypothetical protein
LVYMVTTIFEIGDIANFYTIDRLKCMCSKYLPSYP